MKAILVFIDLAAGIGDRWDDNELHLELGCLSIVVRREHRRRGIGHKMLLTSSQVNEASSKAWHRARGFSACGFLVGLDEENVGELFRRKDLTRSSRPAQTIPTG